MPARRRQEFLARVPLFAGCTRRELDALARTAEIVDFPAGQILMTEGGSCHEFLVIVDGQVEVERGGTIVAKLGPDDYVGELALLDAGPRTATVRTATVRTTTATTVVLLGANEFWSAVDSIARFDRKLLAGIARRLRSAEAKLG